MYNPYIKLDEGEIASYTGYAEGLSISTKHKNMNSGRTKATGDSKKRKVRN